MAPVDLHIHTTASDGTDSPTQVVERAKAARLSAIAITDHDTMSGVAEAQRAGAQLGICVLAGMELSTQWSGSEIHLLGYFVSPAHQGLRSVEEWNQENRRRRNRSMVERLQSDGCPISWEQLNRAHPGTVLGRPHIASALVQCGWANCISDAFARYLSPGCPYYVPREKLPLEEGIRCVREAGGLAVVAHPLQYAFSPEKLEALAAQAAHWGACGLEVYYSGYGPAQRQELLSLCERYHLLPTGGSDYHGTRKPTIHLGTGTGSLQVPDSIVTALHQHWAAQNENHN